ncbi:hypothetical protein EJ04DRAFT_525135 [Polyplosphaeria fusca]|uniref:1,3-beta-glucanosyltransferase n=1 Tax=Polyplosphaeria fusca TaxID=682080 RepID=A0A9P4QUF9_9PLEO|nr:hypothetical protein EJ04DRAFT_525135 [Polyplosphaeria fusca]
MSATNRIFRLQRFWQEHRLRLIAQGSHFFYPNGSQFVIHGVGYQIYDGISSQNFADPLSDVFDCDSYIKSLQDIKVNVIQVAAVNPNLEHAGCMEAFANAGIYVLAPLFPPILLQNTEANWDSTAYNYSTSVINNLGKFNNVLGFVAPNIIGYFSSTVDLPLSKAMIRDAKNYMKINGMRDIPVGVIDGTADTDKDSVFGINSVTFLSCEEAHGDFYGLSDGRLGCLPTDWIERQAQLFADASMPVLFLSNGCNDKYRANDSDNYPLQDLFSGKITKTISGGILYDFLGCSNNRDPPLINSENVLGDVYKGLSSVMATVSITTMDEATYTPTSTSTACPTPQSEWTTPPPTLPQTPSHFKLCSCMMDTLDCVADSIIIGKLSVPDNLGNYMTLLCGEDRTGCPGTASRPANGVYGAFSNVSDGSCTINGSMPDNPDFHLSNFTGAMDKQTPKPVNNECQFLLAQAGENGTETIKDFDFAKTATSSDSSSPTSTGLIKASESGGGLPIGAKAGIGVGIAVVVISAMCLALFLFRRRKRQSTETTFEKAEMDGTGMKGPGKVFEAPAVIAEVPAMNETPIELPSEERPVEAEADGQKRESQLLPSSPRSPHSGPEDGTGNGTRNPRP